MPCVSDYLAATKEETDSRKFCRMLCYVLASLGRASPPWAIKAKDEYYGDKQKVNDAVVMLCETIRSLSETQLDCIVYDGKKSEAREVADFWDAHEAADKSREAREAARLSKEHRSDEEEFERLKAKLGR